MNLSMTKMGYEEVYSLLLSQSEDFPYPIEFVVQYAKKLSDNAEFMTAYNDKNLLCGIIAYYANRLPMAYISHLWVNAASRGKGICGMMLQALNESLAKKGFEKIRLETRKKNASAINAYMKNGYEIISSNDDKYLMECVIQND